MIRIDVEQGSSKWHLLRYGIVTASEADELVTPKKWEPTSGEKREKYLCRKIGERIALAETADIEDAIERAAKIERMLNRVQTESMLHGVVSEPRAVNAYEFLTGNETEAAGFIMNDTKTAGASVDRMIKGTKRGLEIKSPFSLGVYVGYCLSKGVDAAYLPQLIFQLWVADLESIDIYAWYEGRSESKPVTVPRDEEKIKRLAELHAEFNDRLEDEWKLWQGGLYTVTRV
ncbi:MAG: YqaJ viral recombinase family protein [Patescibacteria group bacterium]|nr:YqaJ viral recombinase family protein [Patescibacteria group bacterium]